MTTSTKSVKHVCWDSQSLASPKCSQKQNECIRIYECFEKAHKNVFRCIYLKDSPQKDSFRVNTIIGLGTLINLINNRQSIDNQNYEALQAIKICTHILFLLSYKGYVTKKYLLHEEILEELGINSSMAKQCLKKSLESQDSYDLYDYVLQLIRRL